MSSARDNPYPLSLALLHLGGVALPPDDGLLLPYIWPLLTLVFNIQLSASILVAQHTPASRHLF